MALYAAQVNAKRQKTVSRDSNIRPIIVESCDHFQGIPKIDYRPDAGFDDTLCYRYYNATEKIHGRCMEDWLRPSISFYNLFHRFDERGLGSFDLFTNGLLKSIDDYTVPPIDNYKRRIKAAFDFYTKLGIKYWTVYDRDLAPEGETIEETNHNFDEVIDFVIELQQRTNIKPLWVAANLNYNPRYFSGACTSTEPQVISYAGAQLKKAIEIAQRLGSECFLFQSTREGYGSPLNTDHNKELKSYARLLKMIADYKERLGYRGRLLFQPNHTNNAFIEFNHSIKGGYNAFYRYDYDTASAVCFLKHYNLDKQEFKINTKPGHELILASMYGMLGSIDTTFTTTPPDLREATLLMKKVIEHGGLQPGGLNIGLILRPDFTEIKDLIEAYSSCIDVYAKGLRIASKMISDGIFAKNLQQRYLGFHSGFGSRFINGEASLEECEDQIKKFNQNSMETTPTMGHTEHWESVFARYCNAYRI